MLWVTRMEQSFGQPKAIEGHLGDALEFGGQPECVELPSIFNIGESPASYEAWFFETTRQPHRLAISLDK